MTLFLEIVFFLFVYKKRTLNLVLRQRHTNLKPNFELAGKFWHTLRNIHTYNN